MPSETGESRPPNLGTVTLSTEQRVDLEDWDAFRRLDRMSDHWWWRPGWRPDRYYLTWYVVFDDQALRDYVTGFQQAIADLVYLDPVPADGIHMTVQGVAFADELTADTVAAIAQEATDRCSDLEPFTLTVGPIGAYSGGTFVRAAPWQPDPHSSQRRDFPCSPSEQFPEVSAPFTSTRGVSKISQNRYYQGML